jgi:hypothetical protein
MVLLGRIHHAIVFYSYFGPFVFALDRIRALHKKGKRLDHGAGELLLGCDCDLEIVKPFGVEVHDGEYLRENDDFILLFYLHLCSGLFTASFQIL